MSVSPTGNLSVSLQMLLCETPDTCCNNIDAKRFWEIIDMEKLYSKIPKDRNNEKGAALVMAILVSFLLLVASAGLLLETSTNTQNVTDATAEQEAFNAAESGIQAAVYVLRDNVTLPATRLLNANPPGCATASTAPQLCKANRIDYLKALNLTGSNLTTTGLDATPRLSRWMNYETTATDRVKMGDGTYVAQSGYAYRLEISDPDHTGSLVTFSTTGRLGNYNGVLTPTTADDQTDRKLYGDTTNGFMLKYVPKAQVQIDTVGGTAPTDFGSFELTKYGNGAAIVDFNRFTIITTMTVPYAGIRTMRGFIESNTCVAGVCSIPKILVDSQTFTIQGSQIVLGFNGGTFITDNVSSPPKIGYEANMTAPSSTGVPVLTTLQGTMSSPEPIRLLIRSIGFGPRGSTKTLEAIIQKNFFNGLTAPATLTLIGPNSTSSPSTTFTFNPGSSNVATYTGADQASTDVIPPIGTSNSTSLETVYNSVDGLPPHPFNGDVVGVPTNVSAEMPTWLSSPANLDSAVRSMYNVANSSGRYFANGVQPSTMGSYATGQGITFCDGNCELNGSGGGILIVTGKLTLRGNFSFKGLIIVTGQAGVDRQGGGNGEIQGNMVIAPYVNSSVLPVSNPIGATFLAPQYDLSGGGNSTISYNSSALGNGLLAVDNFILGVVEK
ncbi:MAG: hypothetical protein ABI791_00280 [Acidobacteriota bacterium]